MTGKIYFAYADPGDPFNDAIHNVEDEQVFNIEITQSEGEFATAGIEIINPGVGLLNPLRKTRVFISIQNGLSVDLLFSGRIVGFPVDFGEDTITLTAIAQPVDWEITQDAFIQALKVAPYYNDLFISEDNRQDQTEILSGYSSITHWHRATEAIVLSDIIEGSNFIDIGEDYIFDSLSSSIGDPPLKGVNITVEAQWQQLGVGEVDCSESIRLEFTNTAIASPQINTLTPRALEAGWQGARIPTGYSVISSKLTPVASNFGLTQANLRSSLATVTGANYPASNGAEPLNRQVSVPRVWYIGTFVLQANYEQKRRETFNAVLEMSTQDIALTSDKYEDLILRIQDPTAVANGEVLDIAKPSFFMDGLVLSTYGQEVIETALMRARARLIKTSRIVETTFQCKLDLVLDITCDHSIRIQDSRLPGGSLRGKVLGYKLSWSESGEQIAEITIGSTIGTGDDSTGTGTNIGTFLYDNEYGSPTMTSEIFYNQSAPPVISEPIDVEQMETDNEYLIEDVTVTDDGETQNNDWAGESQPDVYMQNHRTRIEIELKSMNPEPEIFTDVPIDTYLLTIPKQVDLEAS